MKKLEKLEKEVESLSREESEAFRAWFLELDWNRWDREFEEDAASGKLNDLADEAIRDRDAGRSTQL
ncbi:MAG: hypothetical protein ACYDCC_07865 [Actinomycetota bacterium]